MGSGSTDVTSSHPDEFLLACPPLRVGRAFVRREALQQREDLSLHGAEPVYLLLELGQAKSDELLGVPAWAEPPVADLQQFPDLAKSKADPLRATDEPETLDGLLAGQAVARCRAPRRGRSPIRLWYRIVSGGTSAAVASFERSTSRGQGTTWSALQGQQPDWEGRSRSHRTGLRLG
jgi:hypothetical protein